MGLEKAYLCRLTTLLAMTAIAPAADKELASKDFLPVVLKLAEDGVPNVRFNAAKCLEGLIPKLDQGYVPTFAAGD